jgi:hypothetical protein
VRNLQLGAFTAYDGRVFTPIELERFTGREHQWNECTAPGRVQQLLLGLPPLTCKRCHPPVRTGVPLGGQGRMQLLRRPPLLV